MITTDLNTGRVTFFLSQERQLEMSASEYEHFESLIKNPPHIQPIRPCTAYSVRVVNGLELNTKE
ncbi:hypothetical protein LCGC14_0376650 [marine sediment metagenome]|uniref:Uncharacterized protein n=1 Tax=marine sediment metagenome TaxID=412755 RepID=A0A0F9T9E5_9ZZZZ